MVPRRPPSSSRRKPGSHPSCRRKPGSRCRLAPILHEVPAFAGMTLKCRAQLLDLMIEDPVVLGIIDRAVDQVHARSRKAVVEQGGQPFRALDPVALRPI